MQGINKVSLILLLFMGLAGKAFSQMLTLPQAIRLAVDHYGVIRAKGHYVNASRDLVRESKREYLPDLNLSGQQDFGTVDAQNGPVYGFRGYGVASSGPLLATQSWNAAFGALYLTNVSWDFFAFGRAKEKVKVSEKQLGLDSSDWQQEIFEHKIRVSAAYLNLLAAQRLTHSQQDNLDRALALFTVVEARARNGLNPGVDSSLAAAEVSNARISLTNAQDYEQEESNALASLMGINQPDQPFSLDTVFVSSLPNNLHDSAAVPLNNHPLTTYYRSRIILSDERARLYQAQAWPVFSLFGIFQGRASGFDYNYGMLNPNAYSHGYWSGVDPNRSNYLLGLGMTWDLTSPLRIREQVSAQRWISRGLQDELGQIELELHNQLTLSDAKIRNALANFREAPVQLKAAGDAYAQKSVMYKNGLSNIVDVTQALFTLNRAETERDIASNNVWQALLIKTAALGDFDLFIQEQ